MVTSIALHSCSMETIISCECKFLLEFDMSLSSRARGIMEREKYCGSERP